MAQVPLSDTSLFSDAALQSYWKFDETSGTSVADSKGSNTGTASNSAILNVAGKFSNGSTYVKASSHNVDFGDIFSLPAYTDMSFSFWYKTTTTGVNDSIISNYSQSAGGGFSIDLRTDDKIHLDTWSGAGANTGDVASLVTVNDGNWHHIVVIKASNTGYVYVDNDAGNSGAITPVNPTTSGKFFSGGEPRVYGYSDCSIDDLAVFSKALSSTERAELYNGLSDSRSPSGGAAYGSPMMY